MLNIALYGRSGSGKSSVAEELLGHGYQHLKTGRACRRICTELFDSDDKSILNQVTDALRAIDPSVWLRSALGEAASDAPIVFDSMRFPSDYVRLRDEKYLLVRVEAERPTRLQRLAERGQEYDPDRDDGHEAEVSLHDFEFDVVIDNSGDREALSRQVLALLNVARGS